MILKVSIVLFLVNDIICSVHFAKLRALDNALERTNDFFEEIRLKYAGESLNKDILIKIEERVVRHVRNVTKPITIRYKRELPEGSNRGIDVLNGFNDYRELNFDGAQDINFFSLEHGSGTSWFTVVLNVDRVNVYQMNNALLHGAGSYPLINGRRIIISNRSYGVLFVIQNRNGSILILRFSRVRDKYYLQPVQDFELNAMTHLTVWDGMNELHLGISSRSNVSIFTWRGNYFDFVQSIDIGTEKLIPFQSKGFMYLAATGSSTLILKYFLRFNKFMVTQRLPGSRDVSSFSLKERHFAEHYLSLSTESSTVVYKEIDNRFVPFQQIHAGESVVPIISGKAVVLLAFREDTVRAYQYDGWRFVELNAELCNVSRLHRNRLYRKELLLMKHRNGTWTLKQPVWVKRKSYIDLLDEVRIWNVNAKNKAQRTIEKVADLEQPVKILKGHIDNLYVDNINEHNSQKLKSISNQYKQLASRFQEEKMNLKNKWHPKNLTLAALRARKVSIKCKTECKVNRLNIKEDANSLSKLRRQIDESQVLNFKQLTAKEVRNWRCPRLSLPIEDIVIDKSVNGLSLSYLETNALKVTGNQVITGNHTFVNLNATNASMPLDIATYLTSQVLKMKEIKVKELNLTDGGILLPLNGPPTTVTGSIKAPKLKSQGIIKIRGKLAGEWMKRLSPMIFIPEPMFLDNVTLENAKIENLRCGGFISDQFGSVQSILSNAIPLNGNVPVSLKLSSENMKWHNITLRGPQKWITANSQSTSNITGRKHMLRNVEVTKFSYDNLRLPQIRTQLCAVSVIAPEIKTSTLTASNVTVKNLTSSRVFGNLGARDLIDNSALPFKAILPSERYYRNVTAKNITASRIDNVNLTELEQLANLWIGPNILNASIEATNLRVNILRSPARFHMELSKINGNVILEHNAQIDSINDVHIVDFLANAIKLEDMISLQNVTFANGFSTNYTRATHLPPSLTELNGDLNLHKKRISGNVEANSVNLPYSFQMTQNDAPVDIFIKGPGNFLFEPIINNVNNIKVGDLLAEIWLATNSTIFYGRNLHIKDAVIKGKVTLNNSMSTLNPETWTNISKHLLSKTKPQEIKVRAAFSNVQVPVIVGSNVSTITSTVADFNDIFDNALLRNKDQEVKAKWTFDTLKVLGNLHVKGKVNNLNLRSDVMRHDSDENVVTGKKIVTVLTAESINGYDFDKWAENVLTQSRKNVIIKGQKTFSTVTFNDMKVSGTVTGHPMEHMLSKSANQTIYGQKNIQGHVNASELVVHGLVNDVNLTDLAARQLKKNGSPVTIISEVEMQSSLDIIGNLTINGSYAGAEMENFHNDYSSVIPVAEMMTRSFDEAAAINTALQNRAVYISKLEVVRNVDAVSRRAVPVQMDQCKVNNLLPQCANEHVADSVVGANGSDFILLKTVVLDEMELAVLVKHDSVSIHVYDSAEDTLVRSKELHIPNIVDAFVEPTQQSLWILLRLTSQTLALHYQPWNDVQEHVLPASDVFTLSRSPNKQLLLLLSSGVWILDGLGSPRNIIGIPLKEKVETWLDGYDYYVKYSLENSTRLMKARYVGN